MFSFIPSFRIPHARGEWGREYLTLVHATVVVRVNCAPLPGAFNFTLSTRDFAARGFGLKLKICLPAADTELSSRTREKIFWLAG